MLFQGPRYLVHVKSNTAETERYLSTSNRITGVIVMFIGALGLLDIVIEWRTVTGLLVGCLIAIAMMLTYVGLIRPSVTLGRTDLLLRNHLRDHRIPWDKVTGADITDILRVHTENDRFRAPGVQLVMRDLRKQRMGRDKPASESSLSRADLVVDRIEAHMSQYGKEPGGELRTSWARIELIVIAVLAVVAVVAAILR